MGMDLLVVAIALACLAAAVVIGCVASEASEAWQISRRGWAAGHRHHHTLHHHTLHRRA